jgi:hypothetical protein
MKRLFEQFDAMLRQAGYIAMSGEIVEATLVAAPRQHNTDDERTCSRGQGSAWYGVGFLIFPLPSQAHFLGRF